jgi:HEAT repeat protein
VSDAVNYLLGIARTASDRTSADAILPLALADSTTAWPDLLALARDRARPVETRKRALYWAAQLGEREMLAPTVAIANDPAESRTIREHAVFVLSQDGEPQATDELMRIARSGGDREVRKRAIFWLGQRRDPRAVEFLASMLER